MSTRTQKIKRLATKEYRDAFVGSQINVGLPFQIRALREQRGWKQSDLAAKAEMLQPRISAMERSGGAKFNIETLRRLAAAYDVALEVRFVPFSELVDWSERFNPDTFKIPSFADDPGLIDGEPRAEAATSRGTTAQTARLILMPLVGEFRHKPVQSALAEATVPLSAKITQCAAAAIQ